MNNIPLSYFYCWNRFPQDLVPMMMNEFAVNGAENLVITDTLSEAILKDPRQIASMIYNAKNAGLKWFEIHAPFGECYDLNTRLSYRRAGMIADQSKIMQLAADMGCKTYVIHIGAWDCVFNHDVSLQQMRDLAMDSIDKLLPLAEKLQIVLAIENSFELSNSPDEVLYYLNRFDSPWIGCCFDVGHANYMAPSKDGSPKAYTDYQRNKAWRGQLVQEPAALEKLLPHIVTCHLHDNNGLTDGHELPGCGTVDWQEVMGKLKTAPRLLSYQSEVSVAGGKVPVRTLCETMSKLVQA